MVLREVVQQLHPYRKGRPNELQMTTVLLNVPSDEVITTMINHLLARKATETGGEVAVPLVALLPLALAARILVVTTTETKNLADQKVMEIGVGEERTKVAGVATEIVM